MWLVLEGKGPDVLFHMGMTGAMLVKGEPIPDYQAFKINSSWPPKYTKIEITFSGGVKLAFCDPRRLGRMRLVHDAERNDPISKLAVDPLNDKFNENLVKSILSKTTGSIKALLLDQEKLVCGVGNWVADEVLYRAGIHPSSTGVAISTDVALIRQLLDAIVHVSKEASKTLEKGEKFPDDWLFHYRWFKGKGKGATSKMPNGCAISFETIGGRSSAVINDVQKKYTRFDSSKKRKVKVKVKGKDENNEGEEEDNKQRGPTESKYFAHKKSKMS
jgi:formamidopyrimidine-DNA glycosylase